MISAEPDVGNDLTTDMLVQLYCQLLATHGQFRTQGRTGQAHKECLVVDIGVQRIARHHRASYLGPRLYQPLLLQRRLQPLLTQITHDKVLDRLNVAFEHSSVLLLHVKAKAYSVVVL